MVNIDKHVSCLLKKCIYHSIVGASIVAWCSVSIVSHIKKKKKKKMVSGINLRKMILKFHYAIAK